MHTASLPRLMTPKQAAAVLGVSPGTLSVWRSTRRYPLSYIKLGRLVRYAEEDISAFLEKRRVRGNRDDKQ